MERRSNVDDPLIVSAVRRPIGKFGGALREVSDWDLGAIAIVDAVKRSGLKGEEIGEVIMGHGFRTGALPPPILREPVISGLVFPLRFPNLLLIRHAVEVSGQ